MSPDVSIPNRWPSESTTGIEPLPEDLSISHALFTVTFLPSVGFMSNWRSRTCVLTFVIRTGGAISKKSRTACVSSLTLPSRAAIYCLSPSAFLSAAYAIADTIESVSGLRCPVTKTGSISSPLSENIVLM